jgi:hypothetical protein
MRSLRIQEIMSRIAVAEPESKIAIFLNPDGSYDARFAGPLLTQLDIIRSPHNLVGVYDRTSNQHEILAKLGYTTPPTGRKRGPKVRRGGYDIVDVPFTGAL